MEACEWTLISIIRVTLINIPPPILSKGFRSTQTRKSRLERLASEGEGESPRGSRAEPWPTHHRAGVRRLRRAGTAVGDGGLGGALGGTHQVEHVVLILLRQTHKSTFSTSYSGSGQVILFFFHTYSIFIPLGKVYKKCIQKCIQINSHNHNQMSQSKAQSDY